MKTMIIRAALVGCLCMSMLVVKAQNPFVKSNVITAFDVSPDGQMIACKWWDENGKVKTLIKDLQKQETNTVDSVNLRGEKWELPGNVLSFYSNTSLLLDRGHEVFSCDIKGQGYHKLFALPTTEICYLLTAPSDKGLFYLVSEKKIYQASMQHGLGNSFDIEERGTSLSMDTEERAIYTIIRRKEDKNWMQVMRWDGVKQAEDLTERFAAVKSAYLVEATDVVDVFIIAGINGIFKLNIQTQECTKLVDIDKKKSPISIMRWDGVRQMLYFHIYREDERNIIHQVNVGKGQGKASERLIKID